MESIQLPFFLVISAHAQTLDTRPLFPPPLFAAWVRGYLSPRSYNDIYVDDHFQMEMVVNVKRMRMHCKHMDDVSLHTYIHKYSDFLVAIISVGLAQARPNYLLHLCMNRV